MICSKRLNFQVKCAVTWWLTHDHFNFSRVCSWSLSYCYPSWITLSNAPLPSSFHFLAYLIIELNWNLNAKLYFSISTLTINSWNFWIKVFIDLLIWEQEWCQVCQKCAKNVPKVCQKCAKNVPSVPKVCQKCAKNGAKCQKTVPSVPVVC